MNNFLSLNIRFITKYFLNESFSLWAILLYLTIEYLRPQSMYPMINILPWGVVAILCCITFGILEIKFFKVKNIANVAMVIYFVIIIISSVFAMSPETAYADLNSMLLLFLVYFIISSIIDSEERLYIFLCFYILITLKLAQHAFRLWVHRGFSYDRYGATAGLGWLANPGELAIQLCIVFAISIYLIAAIWEHISKKKKIIVIAIPVIIFGAVFACGSRGGILGLGSIIFTAVFFSKQRLKAIVLLIFAIMSVIFVITEHDVERFRKMGSAEDKTALNRLVRWEKGLEMAGKNPIIGVGYGNWAVADLKYFGGDGAEPHNIFIECVSELGYSGLFVLFWMIFISFRNNLYSIRIARKYDDLFLSNIAKGLNLSIVSFLVTGFFVTVLYYPFFWTLFAISTALNNIVSKKYSLIEIKEIL
jgi:O-antigen ligase